MDLGPQERETLRQADVALERLLQHRASPDFPKTLLRYASDLEEKLRLVIRYLIDGEADFAPNLQERRCGGFARSEH
jgi:hypothetical protein